MFLRVVFITVLLGSTVIVQFYDRESFIIPPLLVLYGFIGGVYLLTFAYVLVLKKIGPTPLFSRIQVGVDTLLVSFLIYLTGGIESVFSFLYLVVIVYASIVLYKKGSLLIALLSSAQYGGMIALEWYGVVAPFYSQAGGGVQAYEPSFVIYKVVMTILACFLVAFLSSYLAQQTMRTEEELRARQKDLQQLEAFNASIVHSMDSGLLTLDVAGRMTSFNTAAETITGFRRQEVLGRPLETIFPEVARRYGSSIESHHKKPFRQDVTFKKKDGTVGYLGFSVSSLKAPDGRAIGNLLIFQDLTALKIMESHIKRVEKLAAVGEMAAGIAHEIKNPLASMTGSIQLLNEQVETTPVTTKLMQIVLREADRLNSLINDFLLFARPTSGKKEPVELGPAVRETLELFEKDAECRGRISVRRDLGSTVWTMMDPKHLRQILWNLLLNAVEAIEGSGTIHVAAKASEDVAEIVIRDDGCGMSEETQKSIFDPFFTTRSQGSGLGLSIVHRLLESYGGRINVESNPGQGTTFTLYLERIDAPDTSGLNPPAV